MKGVSLSDTLINNVFVLTILTRQPRFCHIYNNDNDTDNDNDDANDADNDNDNNNNNNNNSTYLYNALFTLCSNALLK